MASSSDPAQSAAAARVDLRRDDESSSGSPATDVVEFSSPSSTQPAIVRSAAAVLSTDPRLSEVEPLLRAGNWEEVLRHLGPAQSAATLPASLALLYSVARKERETLGPVEGVVDATALAIRSAAEVLGVSESSALAMVIAKRLLRQNPVAWQKRRAPPARISALIMIAALVLSSLAAWLAFSGHVSVRF